VGVDLRPARGRGKHHHWPAPRAVVQALEPRARTRHSRVA